MKNQLREYWQIIFSGSVVFLILALLCIVGEMDYQDAKLEERATCKMVRDGHWPAYRARNLDCPDDPMAVAINERQLR